MAGRRSPRRGHSSSALMVLVVALAAIGLGGLELFGGPAVAATAPQSTISATATCGADAQWHVTWTLHDIDSQSLVPVVELVPPAGASVTPAFNPLTVAPSRSTSATAVLPSRWKGTIRETVTFVGQVAGPPTTAPFSVGGCSAPPPTTAPVTTPPTTAGPSPTVPPPIIDPNAATAIPGDTVVIPPPLVWVDPTTTVDPNATSTVPPTTVADGGTDLESAAGPVPAGGSSGPGGAAVGAWLGSVLVILGAGVLAARSVLSQASDATPSLAGED